jgi:hypothetical protein
MLGAMPTNAERLYRRLNSKLSLQALIGLPEDADFDCKEWPVRSDAARGSIAKAACGFANATGGVIVIGMRASGRGPEVPDVVESFAPVSNRKAIAAEALDIILKFVEPGIEGVKVKTIADSGPHESGFVLILVPALDGAPRRSKVDSRFYVRIASGTIPMEFFQVEERFGRRPAVKLSLMMEPRAMMEMHGFISNPLRQLVFGLKNESRGTAKFPGVRFKRSTNITRDDFGIDGNGGFGLPPRASESEWIVFRGGVDDVIYPGETRLIGKLIQLAAHKRDQGIPSGENPTLAFDFADSLFVCDVIAIQYEISAEGMATKRGTHIVREDSMLVRKRIRR